MICLGIVSAAVWTGMRPVRYRYRRNLAARMGHQLHEGGYDGLMNVSMDFKWCLWQVRCLIPVSAVLSSTQATFS